MTPRLAAALGRGSALLLAVSGAASLALAGHHASEGAVLLGWSWRYLLGVLAPVTVLVGVQLAAVLHWPALVTTAARRPRAFAALALPAVAGAACWAAAVPGQPQGLLAAAWAASLAGLASAAMLRPWEGLLAHSSLALAAAMVLLPEVQLLTEPRSQSRHAEPRWGDDRTFAFSFPRQEPFIGVGGRLRPSVRAWIARSAIDTQRRVWFATNALGLRNEDEAGGPEADGALTVLNLGDSFAVGFGIDQHRFLGPLTQREHAAVTGRRVRVWNAEVSDPCYGALHLQRHGLGLRPQVVVYGLSGNDLLQGWLGCGPRGVLALGADGRVRAVDAPAPRLPFDAWAEWSYPRDGDSAVAAEAAPPRHPHPLLGTLLSLRTIRWLRPPPGPERPRGELRGELTVSGGATVQRGPRKLLFDGFPNLGFSYRTELPPATDSYAVTLPLLEAMARGARERGARFVLLYLPQRHLVQPQDWDVLRRRWSLAEEDFDLDRERLLLRAFCAQRGIEWVDPTPAFRAAARTTNLYLPWDGHMNEAGHELAARALVEALGRPPGQTASAR